VRVWDIPAGVCVQAMAMGAPVTSLSLSPGRDLLATTHVNKRGVFLWSNQLMFGEPAGVALNSDQPVPVGLPSIATGTQAAAHQGDESPAAAAKMAIDGDEEDESSSDDFYGLDGAADSDDEMVEEGEGVGGKQHRNQQQQADAQAVAAPAVYERTAAAGGGAPAPLSPELVTLSLLPRAQWETLLHLDAIKARSRPIQPPKKPEAAPFFLPTVPGLEGNPVFDTQPDAAAAVNGTAVGAANGTKAAAGGGLAGWGDSDDEGDDGEGAGGAAGAAAHAAVPAAPGSRVVRTKPTAATAPVSQFLRLLRAGGDAGDYSSFLGHVRTLSPAALDRELRSMVLLEGSSAREVEDVRRLLECLEGEVAAARNYEFCQALLQHVLTVRWVFALW